MKPHTMISDYMRFALFPNRRDTHADEANGYFKTQICKFRNGGYKTGLHKLPTNVRYEERAPENKLKIRKSPKFSLSSERVNPMLIGKCLQITWQPFMADLNVNNVPDPTEFRHAIYPYSAF
jgi:hypothetical protein